MKYIKKNLIIPLHSKGVAERHSFQDEPTSLNVKMVLCFSYKFSRNHITTVPRNDNTQIS